MGPEVRAGLWTLFALVVLAGGWLFLRACGMWPMFGWQSNYCPAPVDRHAYAREIAIGEGLRREVHAAEMALAEKPPCPTPASPPPVKPPPVKPPPVKPPPVKQQRVEAPAVRPPSSPPLPSREQAESKDLDKKVETRRGKRGKLQFTLAWKTLDDVDIDVTCPGGVISTTSRGRPGPGVCGDGIKDIDANGNLVRNVTNDPIENVSWAEDVPSGRYLIQIFIFKAKSNSAGANVPFTLRMRWGDQEKVCHDVVTSIPPSRRQTVNGRTVAGAGRMIRWENPGDLPDCNLQLDETVIGKYGK